MARKPVRRWKEREVDGEEIIRTRVPKGTELFGVVEQLLGYCKMYIRCSDGKIRICRIPGRLQRSMWIKRGDFVLVQPWEVQTDERGDVIYKYTFTQISWLKSKGLLKGFEEEF